MRGLSWVVIDPPNTSAATCASVVQPAWQSMQAWYVSQAVSRSTPSRSANRIAITVVLQTVLKREAHAEVRRQAKRRNQLSGTDSLAALWLGCHNATLPCPVGTEEH